MRKVISVITCVVFFVFIFSVFNFQFQNITNICFAVDKNVKDKNLANTKKVRKKPVKIIDKKAEVKVVSKGLAHFVDDFEDGDITSKVEWWRFDRLTVTPVKNNTLENKYIGKYSMFLEGSTINWYIGGMGTYLGLDGTRFNAVKFIIRGNGPKSGLLKIELYDDDNNNWECDINTAKGYDPIADDKFVAQIDVNWEGWKTVTIPFYDFEDENPNVGDDIWNPNQENGSGGLLQLQMIAISSGKAIGKMNLDIDAIKLIKE